MNKPKKTINSVALDEIIEDIAIQRMNSEGKLSLKDIFTEDDIDFEQLMKEIED